MQNVKISSIKKKYPKVYHFLKCIKNFKKKFRRLFFPAWLYLLFRRVKPLSNQFGFDRGTPLDRYYIEHFLYTHKNDIHGTCLELLNNNYIKKFGYNVSRSDVLDIDTKNTKATIYGDLRNLKNITKDIYDCIVLTQVLQFIDDFHSASREVYRILKPGGTLLATLPSMSRIDVRAGVKGDFWRFTEASAQHIFAPIFGEQNIKVESHGNSYAGIAFWIGLAVEEVSKKKLNYNDPNFPVIVTVRAQK